MTTDVIQPPANDLPKSLSRPIKWWVAALMVLGTFAIIIPIQYYVLARDLKRLGRDGTTPWLWPLLVFFPLGMPFAHYRMSEGFAEFSKPSNDRHLVMAALTGCLLASLYVADRVINKLAVLPEVAAPVVILLAIALVFALFMRSISQLKRLLPGNYYANPVNTTPLAAKIIMVVGLLLAVPILSYGLIDDIHIMGKESLTNGWTHPDGALSSKASSDWGLIDVGTFSDGSADAEFALSTYVGLMVFDMNGETSLNSNRRREFHDSHSQAKCEEKRWIEGDRLIRKGELVCQGRFWGDTEIIYSLDLTDGEHAYELYAVATASSVRTDETISRLRKFAGGFSLEDDAP